MSSVAWWVQHLEDVRSDLSVFHRVGDLEAMDADRFVAFASRLPLYDGAVRFALREQPETGRAEPPRVAVEAEASSAASLAALNHSELYGPLPGRDEAVGLFDVAVV